MGSLSHADPEGHRICDVVLFPLTVSVGRGFNAALCFGVTSVIDIVLIETQCKFSMMTITWELGVR